MVLSNFATRTEIVANRNKTIDAFWPIGIDYGFSGVKGFAPNKVFCYPNCAVKLDSFDSMLNTSKNDIYLKDKDGCWVIGEKAHRIMTPENAMNYEAEMYGRNRYFSHGFQALMKVGLGIALTSNHIQAYNGETIVIQTGLPPKYKQQDTDLIKEAIAGDYDFELRIGDGTPVNYRFTVKEENILVMDQPMGSLISTITDNDGVHGQDGVQILRSNTLVFDPGFKTLDIYDISAGMFRESNTFDTLGMHEIFRRTTDEIHKTYGTSITVAGMQNALRVGYVNAFDRHSLGTKRVSFENILLKHADVVCDEAIQKLLSIYNYLQHHDYLIVTGGTGNAWFNKIEKTFRNMETLRILSANKNDTRLSNTYSNVRGYYLYMIGLLPRNRLR